MKQTILAFILALSAGTAAAHNPLVGKWQGPCVDLGEESGEFGEAYEQFIEYHQYKDGSGIATVTYHYYLDKDCGHIKWYSILKLDIAMRKSDLGDGIFEIDGIIKPENERKIFDIVKFSQHMGRHMATFGEAMGEGEASKRPTVFSKQDRIFFRVAQ